MDIDLEKQRLDAMQECVIILIHEYVMQATITKDLESRTTKKFLRNVKDTLKRLEDEYREECREVVKKLSKQNQVRVTMVISTFSMNTSNLFSLKPCCDSTW